MNRYACRRHFVQVAGASFSLALLVLAPGLDIARAAPAESYLVKVINNTCLLFYTARYREELPFPLPRHGSGERIGEEVSLW